MDKEDIQAVLSENRAIPLSEMEKKYIDEMHYSLTVSTGLLEDILLTIEEGEDMSRYEHIEDIKNIVEYSKGIINIESDVLGRGFELTTREENDE